MQGSKRNHHWARWSVYARQSGRGVRLLAVPRLKVAGDCAGGSRGKPGQDFIIIMKGSKAHPSIMSLS